MPSFQGFLYNTLDNLRTRSEGPQYFLQGPRGETVPIFKQAQAFLPDNNLHRLCGRKVRIEGTLDGGTLRYTQVQLLFPTATGGSEPNWEIDATLAVPETAGGEAAAPIILRPGDLGAEVVALQLALAAQGIPNVSTDGFFGDGTRLALENFQQANGLPVTGIYDDTTRAVLPI